MISNDDFPVRPFSEIIADYKADAEQLDSPSYYGLACIAEQLEKTLAGYRDEIDRLKAELAASEIRWTDAKPTTPGWWWRRVGEGREASCAFVGTGWEPGELLAQLHRHSGLWKIENLEGQWSNKPIPMPEN